jgi:hypothetical protein
VGFIQSPKESTAQKTHSMGVICKTDETMSGVCVCVCGCVCVCVCVCERERENVGV